MNANAQRIFVSPFPPIDIPPIPLPELVLAHAVRLADKPALVDAVTGRTLTYGAFAAQTRWFAARLADGGFGKGSVLAIVMPNLPEYAVVFHGAALAGGVVTTVNPSYTERELRHQLTDAGATWLVTVPACLEAVTAAVAGTPVARILVVGEPGVIATAAAQARVSDTGPTIPIVPLAAMLQPPPAASAAAAAGSAGQPPAARVAIGPDDLAALPYSSGTTGLSKGVMLTHRNLVANVLQTCPLVGMGEQEVVMAVLPFFHIYGMQVMMNSTLAAGATLIMLPRFELEPYLRAHQQYRVTVSYVAPPIVVALAKHPLVDQFDLSSVRLMLSGAAPLSAAVAAEAGARIGCEIVQGYGMTELSPVSHFTPAGRNRAGASGLLVPNMEMRIVDPASGAALGPNQDGELWLRGPNVMRGYLNNPAATAATLDAEGWLRTGDIVRVDDDGYMYVVDRLKELIKYKGFQVPPAELEALLLTHPAIADAAVIGLPDDEAGEVPVGYVVLKPGKSATAGEIMAFVAGQVAHFKQVRRVVFIDAVPKSAAGKILRRQLRANAA